MLICILLVYCDQPFSIYYWSSHRITNCELVVCRLLLLWLAVSSLGSLGTQSLVAALLCSCQLRILPSGNLMDGSYYSKKKIITNLTTQRIDIDIDIDNLWLGCGPCMTPNWTQCLNVSIQLALVGPLLTGYGAQVTHMWPPLYQNWVCSFLTNNYENLALIPFGQVDKAFFF
jgi:hypothetical protein